MKLITPDSTDTPEDPGKLKDVQEERPLLAESCIAYLDTLEQVISLLDENADIVPEIKAERDAILRILRDMKAEVTFFAPDYMAKTMATLQRIKATLEARQQAQAKPLQHLESKVPDAFTLANSVVSNALPTGIIDSIEHKLTASNKGNLQISFTGIIEDKAITYSKPYTEYDRLIQDAVSTLYMSGNRCITIPMIYRAMRGRQDAEKCPDDEAARIKASLDKQRVTLVSIDASDEFKRRGIKAKDGNPVKFKKRTYLLNLEDYEMESGGNTVHVYKLLQMPVVYNYALRKNEIISGDFTLLDIKKLDKKTGKASTRSVALTSRRMIIRNYLLRRIAVMKRDQQQKKPKQSRRILLDAVFAEAGVANEDRVTKQRAREFVLQCLDYWQAIRENEAAAYIKSYSYVLKNNDVVSSAKDVKGRGIKGVDIYF